MTISPERVSYELMVLPFPTPGARVRLAYRELHIAVNGTEEQKEALGIDDIAELPRPWDPETCQDPELRHEVWAWLEDVVTWLNHEYAWDVAPLIPSCWPSHPHIVHEVAVVADQRRRAMLGVTSDPLEEWHRYCLTTFIDRMRGRLKDHCSDGHKGWPSRGRYTRHICEDSLEERENVYAADLDALANLPRPPKGGRTRVTPKRLSIVDTTSGEILDDVDD
jgi:hypothetical protein